MKLSKLQTFLLCLILFSPLAREFVSMWKENDELLIYLFYKIK